MEKIDLRRNYVNRMDTNLYETVVGGQADSDVIYKAIPFPWDERLQAVHYLFEKENMLGKNHTSRLPKRVLFPVHQEPFDKITGTVLHKWLLSWVLPGRKIVFCLETSEWPMQSVPSMYCGFWHNADIFSFAIHWVALGSKSESSGG